MSGGRLFPPRPVVDWLGSSARGDQLPTESNTRRKTIDRRKICGRKRVDMFVQHTRINHVIKQIWILHRFDSILFLFSLHFCEPNSPMIDTHNAHICYLCETEHVVMCESKHDEQAASFSFLPCILHVPCPRSTSTRRLNGSRCTDLHPKQRRSNRWMPSTRHENITCQTIFFVNSAQLDIKFKTLFYGAQSARASNRIANVHCKGFAVPLSRVNLKTSIPLFRPLRTSRNWLKHVERNERWP